MTRIYTTTTIRRSPAEVFDYVTTPANWPDWHPSSLGVSGAVDHSLMPGERVEEAFHVAGRRGKVVWTVRGREAPRRWLIAGRILGGAGGEGMITYTLTPADGGTAFEREFVYSMPNAFFALLDTFIIRRRIAAESAEALRRLKQRLESVI